MKSTNGQTKNGQATKNRMTPYDADKPLMQNVDGTAVPVNFHAHRDESIESEKSRYARGDEINTPVFGSVREVMQGAAMSFQNILVESDIAIRENPILQRMMRRDPDVMSPLLQRQFAVALLEWNIVPEDEDDEVQVEQAATLTTLIEHNMENIVDMWRHLGDAVWFGPSAVNVIYEVTDNGVAPVTWRPFHADALEFDDFGKLGMRVGMAYKGTSSPGPRGRVHLFTSIERAAIILHTYQKQGPEWDEPREGRYMYAGRGIRDIVYFYWLMKHKGLKLWMQWIERYAMGNRIGRYPKGNNAAKTEMEKILRNLAGDVSVLIPSDPDATNDAYGIDILEPDAGRAKVFMDLLKGYLAGEIKELILGQTATSEATPTGLGSDVGKRHAETKNDIIKYDARTLAGSATREFIRPLSVMNFGETKWRPRLEFAVEDVDPDVWMGGVEKAINLGLEVPQRQVRGRLGIDEPTEGEPVMSPAGGGNLDDFGEFSSGAFDFRRVSAQRQRYARAFTHRRRE